MSYARAARRDFAKQAVAEDEKGEYEKALQLYLSSLEYFKTYLKYEKNQMCRDAVTQKVRAGGSGASWGGFTPAERLSATGTGPASQDRELQLRGRARDELLAQPLFPEVPHAGSGF